MRSRSRFSLAASVPVLLRLSASPRIPVRVAHSAKILTLESAKRISAFALLLLATAPAFATQHYAKSVTFQATNQNMWGPGNVTRYEAGQNYGVEWGPKTASSNNYYNPCAPDSCTDPCFGILGGCSICISDIVPLCLGEFGAGAEASTGGNTDGTPGKIGLTFSAYTQDGAYNVTFPVSLEINYPDNGQIYPGDSYTINVTYPAGYTPGSGATLSTTTPKVGAKFKGYVDAKFHASAAVKLFGSNVLEGDWSNLNLSVGPLQTPDVLDTDSNDFKTATGPLGSFVLGTITKNVVTGKYHPLNIANSVAGGVTDPATGRRVLRSTKEDTFFHSRFDVTNLLLAFAGVPALNRSIDTHGVSFGLQVLDLYQDMDLKVNQDLIFDPTPKVTLQISDGQTVEIKVGESKTLKFPAAVPNSTNSTLTLTPVFALDNKVTNNTQLIPVSGLNFTPFQIHAGGKVNLSLPVGDPFGTIDVGSFDFGSFALNVAGTTNIAQVPLPALSLFNKQFSADGFNTAPGNAFTLSSYTYPIPTLTSLNPFMIKQGSPAQSVAVTGTNFVPVHGANHSTRMKWNGSERITTFISPTQATTDFYAVDFSKEGTFGIAAFNPAPGGGNSPANQPFIVDGTPPVTTPSLVGPQNADHHGWYKGPVAVGLSAKDNLTGIKSTSYRVDAGTSQTYAPPFATGSAPVATPPFVVSGDLVHGVTFSSVDNVTNAEAQKSQVIKIDGTLPVVTYTGNAGTYTVDQLVKITCASSDNLSLVFSTTCKDVINPAYAYPLGANTFSATAMDYAGNLGKASTTFTVKVTLDSLCALMDRFISNKGIANSFCVKIRAAKAAQDRGDLKTRNNVLGAFINEAAAQSGKALTVDQAKLVTGLARALQASTTTSAG